MGIGSQGHCSGRVIRGMTYDEEVDGEQHVTMKVILNVSN